MPETRNNSRLYNKIELLYFDLSYVYQISSYLDPGARTWSTCVSKLSLIC